MTRKADRFEKLIDKFIPVTESGCWLWTACGDGRYGQVLWNGRFSKAHRVMYELFKGPIPNGFVLDHLCRVTWCVNPEHLEAVTMKQNVLRGVSPIADQSRQTHCKRGHPFTPENTKLRKDNSKNCRICNLEIKRKSNSKLKALRQMQRAI